MAGQQAPSLRQEATRTFPFKNKQEKTAEKALFGSVPRRRWNIWARSVGMAVCSPEGWKCCEDFLFYFSLFWL